MVCQSGRQGLDGTSIHLFARASTLLRAHAPPPRPIPITRHNALTWLGLINLLSADLPLILRTTLARMPVPSRGAGKADVSSQSSPQYGAATSCGLWHRPVGESVVLSHLGYRSTIDGAVMRIEALSRL